MEKPVFVSPSRKHELAKSTSDHLRFASSARRHPVIAKSWMATRACQQASREDSADDTRADAPLNQAAADFDELASYRTGQGVRDLRYRWGQGAQTAQHQQQPSLED